MGSQQQRRELQEKLEKEVGALRTIEKEVAKNFQVRRQYAVQLKENELVKKELALLEAEAKVFKLIGPVLVPQELEEAKTNVEKRVEYINSETKRLEDMAEQLERRQSGKQEDVMQLQKKMQSLGRS